MRLLDSLPLNSRLDSRLNSRLNFRIVCVLAFVLAAVSGTSAQVNQQQQEQIKNLLVVVRTTFADDSAIGAGILFSAEPGRLCFVTAKDIVQKGGETAKSIDVEFRWRPGQRVQAELLNMPESGLGFVVVSVPVSAPPDLLRFDLLGNTAAVNRGDPVIVVGHPNGRLWEAATRPGLISQNDGIRLFFQSNFLAPGSEGSALLNERAELIGMVASDQPPRGEAIGMDRIVLWLKANRQMMDLRPPGAPSPLAQLENEIRDDVTDACGSLGVMTSGHTVRGETILAKLAAPVGKVEADARFSGAQSGLIGNMYRCLGAAYLLHSKLELPEKIPIAVPYLKRSLDFNPAQPLLRNNIAYLEQFQKNRGGNIREYVRNLFQVIDGKDNPASAKIADQLAGYTQDLEFQAKQWFMKEATIPAIQDFLDILRIRLKQETNVDAAVEVNSRKLANGLVEVTAKVGPDSFSWTVDYPNRSYTCNDEFTQKIMAVSVKPKQ
jgi:Trypsin-like peptidase domain